MQSAQRPMNFERRGCNDINLVNIQYAMIISALSVVCGIQTQDVRFQVLTARNMKITAIVLMMAAVRNSETSVYFSETTRRYIPEAAIFRHIARFPFSGDMLSIQCLFPDK
jgi:hypothetical protein